MERLRQKLEDDYLIWYDAPIGRKRQHPDFIILHPERGLIVLEIKDWRLDTIRQINPSTVTLLTPNGEKEERNPLEQARAYTIAIKELLERDKLLIQHDGRHKGKLAFPYSYGVILSNITRATFKSQPALTAAIEPNLVICKDEMTEKVDPDKALRWITGRFRKLRLIVCHALSRRRLFHKATSLDGQGIFVDSDPSSDRVHPLRLVELTLRVGDAEKAFWEA